MPNKWQTRLGMLQEGSWCRDGAQDICPKTLELWTMNSRLQVLDGITFPRRIISKESSSAATTDALSWKQLGREAWPLALLFSPFGETGLHPVFLLLPLTP